MRSTHRSTLRHPTLLTGPLALFMSVNHFRRREWLRPHRKSRWAKSWLKNLLAQTVHRSSFSLKDRSWINHWQSRVTSALRLENLLDLLISQLQVNNLKVSKISLTAASRMKNKSSQHLPNKNNQLGLLKANRHSNSIRVNLSQSQKQKLLLA